MTSISLFRLRQELYEIAEEYKNTGGKHPEAFNDLLKILQQENIETELS